MTTNNRNYRVWTDDEDDKLVEALLNMTNTGKFKSDNGFRTGYLPHLEACLKEALPESGILGKPHIESRIKTLKRDWAAFYDMLNTSGFGYDTVKHSVTASTDVWNSYIATHKHGGKWKNKTLPRYEDLCVIFGKDRAQGKKAKTVIEMEEEVNLVEEEHQRNEDFDEISHNVGTDSSLQVEETSSVRSKKRKRARQVDPLVRSFSDAVVLFADRLKETSVELSEDIKFELDIKKENFDDARRAFKNDVFVSIGKVSSN
ncbi:putative Myb/SANT-like domain-containing protein [Helianthus debilis subsp. tardiflorus]